MTPIEILSLTSFVIVLMVIVCGFFAESDVMKMIGIFLLIANFLLHSVFQQGARWQRDDWQEKFDLVPKPLIIQTH